MEISEVTLLNKKWEQDLTPNLIYTSECDWWNDVQNEARKGQFCVGFLSIWFTKNNSIAYWGQVFRWENGKFQSLHS